MKKFVFFPLFCLLIISCSSTIKVTKDSFKNSIVVSMEMDHNVKLEGFSFSKSIKSIHSKYVREIKDNKKLNTIYYYRFSVVKINQIENNAFIKIDSDTIKLDLGKISHETDTSEEKDEKTNKIETTIDDYINGSIIITNEIENKILNAQSVQYRLYCKDEPIDILISKSELIKLKKFFNTTDLKK
jgi:hypothetical protein